MLSLVDVIKALDLFFESGIVSENKKKAEVFYSQGSMIKMVNKFIVTPNIIVSNSVKDSEVLKEVFEYNLNLFSSLYSQVFTTLVHLHGLKPDVAFELLSSSYETAFTHNPGMEENTFDKIAIGCESDDVAFLPIISNEADSNEEDSNKKNKKIKIKKINKKSTEYKIKDEKNPFNKLISREVQITIKVNDQKIVIPILIKANIIYTNFNNIENMLGTEDSHSFLDRLDDYKAGAITLGDLIFANDLIKNYKKRRIKDRDDLIREMRLREANAASKLAKHGLVGYSRLYQMLVIGSQDAVKVERKLRGSLHKDRVKEAFLDATSSLSLTVIDNDYERVIMYINDLKGSVDLSFKEVSNKSNKSDSMEELLKVLSSSRTI